MRTEGAGILKSVPMPERIDRVHAFWAGGKCTHSPQALQKLMQVRRADVLISLSVKWEMLDLYYSDPAIKQVLREA
jgi:hypothetical protein